MRDPDAQVQADAECAAIGHIRCEEVTFDQEVTRTWCPRCGCDLTNDEEGSCPTD